MYSPMSQYTISPFISLKNSAAQTTPSSHVRTLSNHKPSSNTPQSVQQFTKTPSQKKLTLTTQINPSKHQMRAAEQQMKKRNIHEYQSKGKFDTLRIQTNNQNQQTRQINQIPSISQQSLMILFQQKMENLKHQYIMALKDYEHRIDFLQNQLQKNETGIQLKNEQIKHLQKVILQMKANEAMKAQQSNKHFQLRMQDIEKKISILSSYSEDSHQEIQQTCHNLTQNIIRFIGSKLNSMKKMQNQYIQSTSLKLLDLQHRLSKQKNTQSQGTRGSMQSVGDTACFEKPVENGVSFWDDCFFYPQEKSENCQLVIQMANRRNQAVACWIDYEGFLHYCDSGSFLFNLKGERVHLENEEVKWLESENLLKLY